MNETRTRALVIKATNSDATLAEQHEAFGEIVKLYQDMAYACAYSLEGSRQYRNVFTGRYMLCFRSHVSAPSRVKKQKFARDCQGFAGNSVEL